MLVHNDKTPIERIVDTWKAPQNKNNSKFIHFFGKNHNNCTIFEWEGVDPDR